MFKLLSAGLVFLLFSQVAMSDDNRHHRGRTVIHGIAVTGINDLLGSPIGPGPSAQLVGEFDPSGSEPVPLTPDTSEDAILATHISEGFLALAGVPREAFKDNIDNVPLHKNPVVVAPSIHIRAEAFPASSATAFQASRRDEDPITLGDWLHARGKAIIHCSRDGSRARVFFFFRGLVDNGLYTLWAVPADPTLFPSSFGGVPNVFTADGRGSAFVRRDVAYCPTDGDLLDITAAYHSDGMVYGNFPDATIDGLPSGVVAHDHVVFLLLKE